MNKRFSIKAITLVCLSISTLMQAKPVQELENVPFEFPVSVKKMRPGKIYLNVKRFDKKSFQKIKAFDIDRIRYDRDMDKKSFMTLSKTSTIYERRQFSDFKPSFILSKDYVNKAYVNCKILDINPVEQKIKAFRNVKILMFDFSFEFSTHFEFFDHFEDFLEATIPAKYQDKWQELSLVENQTPDWISVVYTLKKDVKPNKKTSGGRTVNLYYQLDGNKVLHISYKLASFRNIPGFAKSRVVDGQRQEAYDALTGIDSL